MSVTVDYVKNPTKILTLHHEVILTIDIFFVNNLAFFISVARNLKFGTTEYITYRTKAVLLESIANLVGAYNKRSFKFNTILKDPEFETLRDELRNKWNISLNCCSKGEHVPEIECYIRTVQERCRAQLSRLPFKKKLLRQITIELANNSVTWLNSIPPKGGVSDTLAPRVIMTGIKMDHNKHCKIPFGDYAQVYEKTENNMNERTVGAICLGPSYNLQDGYKFYSLLTGKKLVRRQFTPCPMTQDVIDRVIELGEQQAGPHGLVFKDKRGNIVEQYIDEEASMAGVGADITGVEENNFEDEVSLNATYQDIQNNNYDVNVYENNEDNVYLPHQMPIDINIEEENENEENNIDENEENIDENINNIKLEVSLDNEIEEINNMYDNENNNNINDDDNLQQEEEEETQKYITKYGREIKQNEMLNISDNNKQTYCNAQLTAKLMQQVSLREGLRRFGEEGNRAVLAEMEQLHMRDTFKPVLPSNLTPEKKKEVLESIMLLKQKRDGTIKGRNCDDGRKQREFTSKEKAASPTVKLESVFLTSVIKAHKGRDVATVDIPNV